MIHFELLDSLMLQILMTKFALPGNGVLNALAHLNPIAPFANLHKLGIRYVTSGRVATITRTDDIVLGIGPALARRHNVIPGGTIQGFIAALTVVHPCTTIMTSTVLLLEQFIPN